jgi:hypothetical protein
LSCGKDAPIAAAGTNNNNVNNLVTCGDNSFCINVFDGPQCSTSTGFYTAANGQCYQFNSFCNVVGTATCLRVIQILGLETNSSNASARLICTGVGAQIDVYLDPLCGALAGTASYSVNQCGLQGAAYMKLTCGTTTAANSLSIPILAGGIVGGVVSLALVILGIFRFTKNRNQSYTSSSV